MYDMHIHSEHSHDSIQTLDQICKVAIEKGLEGVAVTNHADIWYLKERHIYECMSKAIEAIKAAKEKYADRLKVLCGVELGEFIYSPKDAEKIAALTDYDVILGSVHCIVYRDWKDAYSCINFGGAVPEEKIFSMLKVYFSDMKKMIAEGDFDVLSHLTCPIRYINGKYGRNIDITRFYGDIEEILDLIIRKDIALEINTSGLNTALGATMPDERIIKRYYEMGGRIITIGSDAHMPENIANGFNSAREMLISAGFKSYCSYERRRPVEHAL